MSVEPKMNLCNVICWVIGLVAGVAAYWASVEAVTWLPALLIGIAVAAFIGLVLSHLFCGAGAAEVETAAGDKTHADAVSGGGEIDNATATAAAAEKAAEPAAAAAPVETKPEPAPAPEPEPAPEPAKAAEEPAPVSDTPDYDGDGILEGKDEGTKPEALSGPRDGKADNLKEIKGIGPKLEILCNELGFYHFDQIAAWSADEVAWVNANLAGFKGRVSRDNWVEQAKVLAAGGETEFSARVDKGEVY